MCTGRSLLSLLGTCLWGRRGSTGPVACSGSLPCSCSRGLLSGGLLPGPLRLPLRPPLPLGLLGRPWRTRRPPRGLGSWSETGGRASSRRVFIWWARVRPTRRWKETPSGGSGSSCRPAGGRRLISELTHGGCVPLCSARTLPASVPSWSTFPLCAYGRDAEAPGAHGFGKGPLGGGTLTLRRRWVSVELSFVDAKVLRVVFSSSWKGA